MSISNKYQGDAIRAAHTQLSERLNEDGLVALPNTFSTHDLEAMLPFRRRARGTMSTTSLDGFAEYVERYAKAGAGCFVQSHPLRAVAVLNLGVAEQPGQADDLAILGAEKTPEFEALGDVLTKSKREGLTQRELAEWMEDWGMCLQCFESSGLIEESEPQIPVKRAVDAVRRITIDSARKVESVEAQLSTDRSAFESVAATSKEGKLPGLLIFGCEPYKGLTGRTFGMRLAVRTGPQERPSLTLALHPIRHQLVLDLIAQEFADKVATRLESVGNVAAYLGEYQRGK